ncbi:prolipoprotein diacylglyceryl transferase [bacterium]|nr:prolipoprotein diacylglyceryl transferase [bacterium]
MRQILFQIGPLKFYSYGLMLGISFALGIYVSLWRAKREQVSQDQIFTIAVGIVISALLGSKILHLLIHIRNIIESPLSMFKNFGGGFVFLGGLLTAMLFLVIMDRYYRIGILRMFDIFTPGLALGLGLTRIGCFLSGCCFGLPTTKPWGVIFPEGSFAFKQYHGAVPVHPTQLYSSLNGFLLFILLLLFLKFVGKRFHGQLFAIFISCYSVFRFLVEFIRGDAGRGIYFGLYTSQILSILLFFLGVGILVWKSFISRDYLETTVYL